MHPAAKKFDWVILQKDSAGKKNSKMTTDMAR